MIFKNTQSRRCAYHTVEKRELRKLATSGHAAEMRVRGDPESIPHIQ